MTDLESVATSIVLDADKREFERWRRDGWTQQGSTRLVEVDLVDVSLDNSDPSTGRVPVVQFDVCYDISSGDVVDASGNSVAPPDQPVRGWERLRVANYNWDMDPAGAWRVSSAETLEQAPCDAD
ncbi:hypothetical protein [Xylanimonas protaetiae]|uniref:Uncharacterized protein n=1 Tax=Xylanimonas protaetiae TaxID=2509457 RepID=A0A4P6F6D3_9MICO|nr:hypothetical protein [Xylanimonas protaetiae]QAY68757.1 hypothetical protein ET471_00765 [Xylanimonas protaetiae]